MRESGNIRTLARAPFFPSFTAIVSAAGTPTHLTGLLSLRAAEARAQEAALPQPHRMTHVTEFEEGSRGRYAETTTHMHAHTRQHVSYRRRCETKKYMEWTERMRSKRKVRRSKGCIEFRGCRNQADWK